MTGILGDIVYGLRQLRNHRGFTAVAVVTLALGIGSNTAIFSNVNALILRPFGFPDLDRVVAVWETAPKQDATSVKAAPANFRDWSEQAHSFQQLAAVRGWDANLTSEGLAERVEGYRVSPDFFSLIGVNPQLGRNLGTADFEQGASPVVIVSYGFWKKHLANDASILGKPLLLNGQRFTVVGVAGQEATFPAGAEVWTPLNLSPEIANRADHYLTVLGRLRKDASIKSSGAELSAIANRLGHEFPATNEGHGVRVVSLAEDVTNGTRQFVLVLMGAAVFVLILACVNVANLQLARASGRQKEIAVRVGLGASRWQLIRQLLVESTLLSLIGAAAGIILSSWGMGLLRRDIPPIILEHVPGLKHVQLDLRVLAFTIGLAIITGILAGLVPALRFSRCQAGDVLKENSRGATAAGATGSIRFLLVTSEIALALVLLIGAGLMIKGFRHLLNVEMGFDRSHVMTLRLSLPEAKYQTNDQILGYYDRVLREIGAIPGVRSAACITSLPSGWSWNWIEYSAEGAPPVPAGDTPTTISQVASTDLFATLKIPVLKGRGISLEDTRSSAPVAVVSESMAEHNWPGQDAIGKHIRLGNKNGHEPLRQIVGVVGDVRPSAFDAHPDPTTYVPFTQVPSTSTAIVVRTANDPRDYAAPIAEQLRQIDRDTPGYDVRTLEQVVSDNASGVESSAEMMFIFGVIALTLASAGIFALMAYSVAQRTHEIGVRIALGAQSSDVLRLVASSAAKMAMIGLAIGLGLSTFLARLLSSALYGIVQVDLSIFVILTMVLAFVAALAAYLPARWATRIDPMKALRYE
jgi:putative ABC transport system permease protein